jgi:NAD+ diphosphatase
MFNVAVSMIVVDDSNKKILLIRQYNKPDFVLVAGYVNRGENAEHAVERELMEETGLKVRQISFQRSQYFEPSNTLMLNYSCIIDENSRMVLNAEVDDAQWFSFEEAKKNIKQGSLAQTFLLEYLGGMS